jgi:hypothetical protein
MRRRRATQGRPSPGAKLAAIARLSIDLPGRPRPMAGHLGQGHAILWSMPPIASAAN